MRFDNRIIFSPDNHLNRLGRGLDLIGLEINLKKTDLLKLLNRVINKNNINSGIIRMMVTRGNTDKKIYDSSPGIYISIKSFYQIPKNPPSMIIIRN